MTSRDDHHGDRSWKGWECLELSLVPRSDGGSSLNWMVAKDRCSNSDAVAG